MKIVLSTWSTSENYNADCDFGLVDLTPILAARILSRMDFIDRLRGRRGIPRSLLLGCHGRILCNTEP